jgi:hypothetical protein
MFTRHRRSRQLRGYPGVHMPYVPRLLVNSRVGYLPLPPDEVFTAYLRHSGDFQFRLGAYGLEHHGRERFVGVWVYETEDGGSVLIESRWGADGTHGAWIEDVPDSNPAFKKMIVEFDGNEMQFTKSISVTVEAALEAWMDKVLERVGPGGKVTAPRRYA